MTTQALEERLQLLQQEVEDITARAEALSQKIEQLRQAREHIGADRFYDRLARFQATVVELFPELILECKSSIILLGLAGKGEVGPGLVQFPDYSPDTGDANELPYNRRKRIFGPS